MKDFQAKRKHYDNTVFNNENTQYYRQFMSKYKIDRKQIFKRINKIMHRNKENPMPEHLSSVNLANEFKDYFNSKVQNIRKAFPVNNQNAMDFDGSENQTLLTQYQIMPTTIF